MSVKKEIVKRVKKRWENEEKDYLKTVGENLVRIKKEKNLTSKFISETLEIDKSNYRRIELGKTNISLLLLRRISKVLGVDIDELIE